MRTIVGIRPTGKLHIGHYFSVIKPALEEKAEVLIATYHAPKTDEKTINDLVQQIKSFGVEYVYSQKPAFKPDLYFALLRVARMGELERMTQYKSAKVKTPHLLTYPVLMAHDLVGFDKVIVGEDQKQHVEYANVLFRRLGGKTIEGDYRGGRVMSLTNPKVKMSKSEPEGCLFLDDNFKEKIMGAVTDVAGIINLSRIAREFGVVWNPSNNKKSKELLIEALENTFKK